MASLACWGRPPRKQSLITLSPNSIGLTARRREGQASSCPPEDLSPSPPSPEKGVLSNVVSVFAARPEESAVRGCEEAGTERVVFFLPTLGRDEVLATLDSWAEVF